MHFIVSWDIPSTASRPTYEDQLIRCFSQHKYVKPITNLYIVKVNSNDEYSSTFTSLQNIAKTIPGIQLVVSPIMTGGFYNGWLHTEMWKNINDVSS